MTTIKKGTKNYDAFIWEYNRCNNGDIYDAYKSPSPAKVRSYKDIENRAKDTNGYNHDLKVTGKSSNFYSTMYTFTENGKKYLVKDTYANTYILEM